MKKISVLLLISFIIANITNAYTCDEIIDKAKFHNAEYVELFFVDINGNLKSLFQPIKYLEKILRDGEFVDGSSIKGYTSIYGSDILIIPDMDTARVIKEEHTVQCMCDVYIDQNTQCITSPRYILKNVIQEAHDMGYEFFVGPELEFYLFKDKNATPRDCEAYFDAPHDAEIVNFKKLLFHELNKYEIPVEKIHHEVGPSQYEISIRYDNALTTADTVTHARSIIKSVAQECGMRASFMPKPIYAKAGSGMHIHFSLFDTITGKNAFYNENDPNHLSEEAKQFIAGVLKHIREISVILNPTINSYKRLVPGYEAPVYVCWGKKNRSALIRLPETNGIAAATRAELRCPDSMCNPYLAFAAMLKAGLEGIKNKEELDASIEQNLYLLTQQELQTKNITVLPGSLAESLIYFANSELMFTLFGQEFMRKFYQYKTQEVYNFNTYVTDWERKEYL